MNIQEKTRLAIKAFQNLTSITGQFFKIIGEKDQYTEENISRFLIIFIILLGLIIYFLMGGNWREFLKNISFAFIGLGLSLIVTEQVIRRLEKRKWKGYEKQAKELLSIITNEWVTNIRGILGLNLFSDLKFRPGDINKDNLKNLEEEIIERLLASLDSDRIIKAIMNEKNHFVSTFDYIMKSSIKALEIFGEILQPSEKEAFLCISRLARSICALYSILSDLLKEKAGEKEREYLADQISASIKKY